MDCSRAKTCDPDAWIENAPALSKALARQVREWIMRWEPDMTESIKWNMFSFSGRKPRLRAECVQTSPRHQLFRGTELREYKVWLSTAKQPKTIERRLQETLAALASGRKWAQRKG